MTRGRVGNCAAGGIRTIGKVYYDVKRGIALGVDRANGTDALMTPVGAAETGAGEASLAW